MPNKCLQRLEAFLPFDLEFIYAAAVHLIMADALFANGAEGNSSVHHAHASLDEMISKGNRVAEVRKGELVRLQSLCQELEKQSDQRGLRSLSLLYPSELEMGQGSDRDPVAVTDNPGSIDPAVDSGISMASSNFGISPFSMPGNMLAGHSNTLSSLGTFEDTGISSEEFFSIVDQMESWDIYF